MTTDIIHNVKEAAEILTKRLLPSSAKPLTERSVARLCKIGRITGSYMAQGDWCIPYEVLEGYIESVKMNGNGRAPRTRRKKKDA